MIALGSTALLANAVRAQNPLLGVLEPIAGADAGRDAETEGGSGEAESAGDPSGDPLVAIENALAVARQRHAALDRARSDEEEAAPPSSTLDLAARLVRILEQRREAQIQTNSLALARVAIESGFARDPSEIVADPPPFPVPTLDGVLVSWRRAVELETTHRTVLEDRRANLRLARDHVEDLDKERRRLRDSLQKEKQEIERIRLETDLRSLTDRLRIAREEAGLAEQRIANTTIQHEFRESSTRQARAALAWVESQLAPRDTDLSEAIEKLDRQRLAIDRDIELARTRLISAEGTLRATEERRGRIKDGGQSDYQLELEARRAQLSHRQQIVALLNDRIERLGGMRTSWQHRYAVLSDRLDLAEAPAWRDAAQTEIDRLTRLRRIHETELAEARLELANLLRKATEPEPDAPNAQRWIELQFEDLEELVDLYQLDLDDLESAIALEDRLHVELVTRMKDRDLGEHVRSLWAAIVSFWSYELTTSADSPITPGKILIALTVVVLGLWFARVIRSLLSRRLFPRVGFDSGASSAFASLAFYALLAVVFLFALQAVNIPLTAFAVAGGALAIGIGFGSQTILSNFISGLLLLAERPIRTGDLIEVGGIIGTVESIGLRSTRIRTPDNFHIIVPNASFLESNVVNWTHEDPILRLRVDVGVAYGSPARRVEELLVQAATDHPRSLPNPAPVAVFQDFGDSALSFQVRFWIRYDEQTDRSKIQSDLRFRIDELFAENGVVIAFPQMDVHLDVATAPGASGEA